MNKVLLTGRITHDLELKKTNSNKSYLSFAIAVDDGKDANGNKKTIFVDCTIWGSGADFLSQYAGKGVLIGVIGKVVTDNYTNSQGQKVKRTYVRAEHSEILSKPQQQTATTTIDDFDANNFEESVDGKYPWE